MTRKLKSNFLTQKALKTIECTSKDRLFNALKPLDFYGKKLFKFLIFPSIKRIKEIGYYRIHVSVIGHLDISREKAISLTFNVSFLGDCPIADSFLTLFPSNS